MATTSADLQAFPIPRPDPYEIPSEYARLREQEPVSRVRLEDGAVAWLVTGFRESRQVLGSRKFSSDMTRPGFPIQSRFRRNNNSFGRTLIRMDPPEHTRYRRLLSPEFMISKVEALRPEIQAITDDLLDELARHTPPVDLVRSFALPLPSLVICELLGIDREHRDRFEELAFGLTTTASVADEALRVIERLRDFMEDVVAAKREQPRDDLLSRLIEHEDSGEMTHVEVVDMARLLLLAGHVTTANMISLGVLMLLRHPEQLDALRSDPSLVVTGVEELLRHQTLIQAGLRRVAVEDAEVGDQLIKAGEGVIVLISAANRDAGLGSGEDFDIHSGVRGHLAFGYGFHQCLGQLLARIELQVALVSIFRRFPALSVAVAGGAVTFRDDGFLHGVRELPVTW